MVKIKVLNHSEVYILHQAQISHTKPFLEKLIKYELGYVKKMQFINQKKPYLHTTWCFACRCTLLYLSKVCSEVSELKHIDWQTDMASYLCIHLCTLCKGHIKR